MLDRKPHTWKVTLAKPDGTTIEGDYSTFWDPAKVEPEDVARAAAAEAFCASDRSTQIIGVSATLVE